jgi:phosphate transport system substrate-binding protein
MRLRHRGRLAALAAATAAVGAFILPCTPASADEPIHGQGSTWSYPAIQQWQADLANRGETVNYDSIGSTAGRVAFYNGTADFAVSEIPFQPNYCTPSVPPVCNNEQQLVANSHRTYAYMPIVAGGTSIGYNLQINGQQFRGLRLSSGSLAGIFLGTIKFWDDPSIRADNPGVSMPHVAVHPVGRSDGSGTSYQFTAYLHAMQPAATAAFCASQRLPSDCLPTSQYPPASFITLQNGSDGVANYVNASYSNGAIGYAEYAYWTERGAPVASIRNASGQYTQPTAVNVAVALTKALINSDNTQNLSQVYVNPDARTYPISSYSYMIVPTNDQAPMDTGKGATLSKFILYFLCQGQQEAQPLGYSPLPPNLVQLGYNVNNLIPGGTKVGQATAANCNNPTFHGFLAQNGIGVPSIVGHGGNGGGGPTGGGPGSSTTTPGQTSSTTAAAAGPGGSGTGGSNNSVTGSTLPGAAKSGSTTTSLGPNAGQGPQSSASGVPLSGGSEVASGPVLSSKPIRYGSGISTLPGWSSILVLVLVLAALVAPPAIWLLRRRDDGPA